MLRLVVAVGCAAALAGCGGKEERPIVLVTPRAVDPGGSETARVRLGVGGKLFGVNDQTWLFTGRPQPQLDQGVTAERQLAETRSLGVNALRITLSWYDIEPSPGTYDMAYVQRVKALTDPLEREGGRVLPVLGVPPLWARAAPGAPTSAIVDRDDVIERYAAFAAFVARTWPRAVAIETWNEPNTTYFWRPRRPEPALYARMHKAAAAAIRAARPSAKVILGSILGTPRGTKAIVGAQRWLKSLYAEGLEPADYDAIGFHPYPIPSAGRVPPLNSGAFATAFDDVRLGYRDADPAARVWITEIGYSSTGGWALRPDVRAAALVALVRKVASLPEVDAIFVHSLYDAVQYAPGDSQRGFGLVHARGAAAGEVTPAFCALRAMTRTGAAEPRC